MSNVSCKARRAREALDLDKPGDRMLCCLGMPDLKRNPGDQKVLACIAYHDGKGNASGCFPSVKRIASLLSISERTVHKSLRRLCKSGRLKITRRQRQSNLYEIDYIGF